MKWTGPLYIAEYMFIKDAITKKSVVTIHNLRAKQQLIYRIDPKK